MDPLQSVVSPFKIPIIIEPEKQKSEYVIHSSGNLSKGIDVPSKEVVVTNSEGFIGVLEVYIHQARDIQNICIYHKQDVYAKVCLTSDPEDTLSTKIINGGGRNPVFDESLRLKVRTLDSSLKCEIYMMSRVRNYLEDQLLGFALVPLSEVLIKDGKLEKDFSLSSTDLFHSPAGFVHLSLSYNGTSPEVLSIPGPLVVDDSIQDSEIQDAVPCELNKIEFPDPSIVKETQMMVSEVFGIPCTNLDSKTCESLAAFDSENHPDREMGVRLVESFSSPIAESVQASKLDSPLSSVSSDGISSPSIVESSESSDATVAAKSPNQENGSLHKEKKSADVADGKSDSSGGISSNMTLKPVITVNKVPEPNVVQQDIVDMYVKSMQQFTESLAKMKLPLDIDSGLTSSGSSSSDQKVQTPKSAGARVFYGSSAFF